MSSILKALKKLEDEKVTRKPESLKIHSEILRDSTTLNLTPLRVGIAAVLVFICGGGATYLYVKSDVQTALVSPVTEANKQPAQSAVSSPSKDIPVERVASNPIVPAEPRQSPTPPSLASSYRAVAVQKKRQQPPKNTVSMSNQITTKEKITSVKPTQPLLPLPEARKTTASSRPLLKVDGIAFQEGDNSVAIINGAQATKTSIIEGAKVEAILRDRVLFTLAGERFEVLLGHTNQ